MNITFTRSLLRLTGSLIWNEAARGGDLYGSAARVFEAVCYLGAIVRGSLLKCARTCRRPDCDGSVSARSYVFLIWTCVVRDGFKDA